MESKVAGGGQSKHETHDANVHSLVWWGAGVFALLAAGIIASAVVFHYFVTHQGLGPPASSFENVRALPPQPHLQVTPARDLEHYQDDQSKVLDSYGWVDQKAGIVRIPIQRAMDLLIEKGLPARSNAAHARPSEDQVAGQHVPRNPRQGGAEPVPAGQPGQ